MAQPLSDYFALEAGEYLDQLDALLTRSDSPDPERLFRAARGVRGSAQIAGVSPIALVAERLEEGARALRERQIEWSDEVRQRALRTVDDLRVLVRAHPRWGADEEERARAAVERWGGTVPEHRRDAAAHGGEQIFSFVEREITQVVAEMDRVADELREAPAAREPLRTVLRRMRPVRGVAGMPALAPVLEVLEGIEDAVHEVMARSLTVEGYYLELLHSARDALAAAGGHLAAGEAPGDSPELDRFREIRDRGDEQVGEAGIVPLSALFAPGGANILASPMAPVPSGGGEVPGDVESFLRIESTGFLDRAEALVAETEARPGARFSRVARQLADLAMNVRELAATYGLDAIASAASAAADALRGSGSPEAAREAIEDLRAALPGAAPRRPRREASPAPVQAPGAGSADPAGPGAGPSQAGGVEGVVPIEALLYDPRGALRAALGLRPQIEQLAGPAAEQGPFAAAIDELFGLVELGLTANRAS
jgi:HPt (histidine-containing phosphotransfer) domain-containing protein